MNTNLMDVAVRSFDGNLEDMVKIGGRTIAVGHGSANSINTIELMSKSTSLS